ncbi:hypothetical protein [Negativicoccus succinicivorans]|uniref:hypothetical protein n=1 Tax=Negativicoccus succinicivorans TaxID=620903 RepID=UPI0026F0E083|nr:hypothetical protein [Negativicoccus succinicivorans]
MDKKNLTAKLLDLVEGRETPESWRNWWDEHEPELEALLSRGEFLKLIESAKKYLKEHLGESKTLNISKWKSEASTLKKEKKSLYNQILEIREEVKQAESVRSCIEKLLQENRGLTQVKRNELDP